MLVLFIETVFNWSRRPSKGNLYDFTDSKNKELSTYYLSQIRRERSYFIAYDNYYVTA